MTGGAPAILMTMKPPPPTPEALGSAILRAKATAIAASTALPPFLRISSATAVAAGWAEATMASPETTSPGPTGRPREQDPARPARRMAANARTRVFFIAPHPTRPVERLSRNGVESRPREREASMTPSRSLAAAAGAAVLALTLFSPSAASSTAGEGPVFEAPLLLTSAGQSPDVQIAAVLAKRAGIDHTLVKLATAKDLAGVKTLGLVVGASLKGLGAAGIDMAKEKARVQALLAEAAKKGIPVLFLHLGGDQRRGELTDAMVAAYLPAAKMAVIVKSADADGLFSRISKERAIPLVAVEKTTDAAAVLKGAFKPKT